MVMGFPRVLILFVIAITAFAAKPVVKSTKPASPKSKKPALTADERAAQSILKSLTLHDRVAQLVIGVALGDVPNRKSPEYEKFRHWVRDLHIGGMIINNPVTKRHRPKC